MNDKYHGGDRDDYAESDNEKDHENTRDRLTVSANIRDMVGYSPKDDAKKKRFLNIIFDNENYIVIVIFIFFAILLCTIILTRKFKYMSNKKPSANPAAAKKEGIMKVPDFNVQLPKPVKLEKMDDDKILRRTQDDLRKIKDQENQEKLDRLNERLRDRPY